MDASLSDLLFFFSTLFFSYLVYEIHDLRKRLQKLEAKSYELHGELQMIKRSIDDDEKRRKR